MTKKTVAEKEADEKEATVATEVAELEEKKAENRVKNIAAWQSTLAGVVIGTIANIIARAIIDNHTDDSFKSFIGGFVIGEIFATLFGGGYNYFMGGNIVDGAGCGAFGGVIGIGVTDIYICAKNYFIRKKQQVVVNENRVEIITTNPAQTQAQTNPAQNAVAGAEVGGGEGGGEGERQKDESKPEGKEARIKRIEETKKRKAVYREWAKLSEADRAKLLEKDEHYAQKTKEAAKEQRKLAEQAR